MPDQEIRPFVIERKKARFEFLQLADQLRERILSGDEYPPGSQLPPVLVLQGMTGLHPRAIRRAYRVLADEGLVQTTPGRGTFVVERPPR